MREPTNGKARVRVLMYRGDVNADGMVKFKNRLARLMHQKQRNLVLDLAQAKRIDFSGLGILIERLQKVRAMQGDIRIANAHPRISATFNRVGLHDLLGVFSSREEAIRSFQGAA